MQLQNARYQRHLQCSTGGLEKLKFFSETKKFGFIAGEEKDIFFHITGLRTFQYGSDILWDEGMVLEFDCVESEKGPVAQDITAEDGELLPVKVIHDGNM